MTRTEENASRRAIPALLCGVCCLAVLAAGIHRFVPPLAQRPGGRAAGRAQSQRPVNFVVFLADDHGEGDLGCYGHPSLKTPNIDRLAAEGMRFERAFLKISSCSPSRASILSGRYPHSTGAEDLHLPLPADQQTIADHLRRAAGEPVPTESGAA